MQATSKLDQLAYDANTITAGDFTVELDINDKMSDELDRRYNANSENSRKSKGLFLKELLIEEV